MLFWSAEHGVAGEKSEGKEGGTGEYLSSPVALTMAESDSQARAHRKTTSFQGRSNHSVFSAAIDLKPLASIRVLHFLDRSSDVTAVRDKNAAYAVPLPSFADPESSYPPLLRSPEPGRMLLGIVEAGTLSKPAMPVWANFLFNLVQKDKLISAIVLRVDGLTPDDDRLALLDDLVARLYNRAVPVILSCHHDSSGIDLVDFGFAGGVIVENACILSDGSRRDYFRSARLRQIMTRCAEQRRERPGFLVGFHDVWEQRPSAAVVCRALKLARHFEAVYGHGPKQVGQDFHGVQDVAQTISGFEFLRRPETCEVCENWLSERKPNELTKISCKRFGFSRNGRCTPGRIPRVTRTKWRA